MTVPVWVLLAFAVWTLLTLLLTVGVYRWSRILTARSDVAYWRADEAQGNDFYRRAMRAHANCVENLPVYGALVVVLLASEVQSPTVDTLSIVLMGGRICQTIVHVSTVQTNPVATARFVFFFVQVLCMLGIAGIVAASAL